MPHSQPLCDFCKQNPATVFVTRVAHHNSAQHPTQHHASIQRLCADCARRHAAGKDWLQSDATLINTADIPGSIVLDDVVKELFQQMKKTEADGESLSVFENQNADFSTLGDDGSDEALKDDFGDLSEEEAEHLFSQMELAAEHDLNDDVFGDNVLNSDDPGDDSPAKGVLPLPQSGLAREVVSARCSKCGTTWDRLRQDGRAGCAHCYVAFHEKLVAVMEKMQRHPHHTGKLPRAALKRSRRLEQLRARRDHRLEMLKRRLEDAVTSEKYEEAAQLRDKIKIVVSTIVGNDLD